MQSSGATLSPVRPERASVIAYNHTSRGRPQTTRPVVPTELSRGIERVRHTPPVPPPTGLALPSPLLGARDALLAVLGEDHSGSLIRVNLGFSGELPSQKLHRAARVTQALVEAEYIYQQSLI